MNIAFRSYKLGIRDGCRALGLPVPEEHKLKKNQYPKDEDIDSFGYMKGTIFVLYMFIHIAMTPNLKGTKNEDQAIHIPSE